MYCGPVLHPNLQHHSVINVQDRVISRLPDDLTFEEIEDTRGTVRTSRDTCMVVERMAYVGRERGVGRQYTCALDTVQITY